MTLNLITPDLWRRLAITVAALLAFRLAAHIPLYGISPEVLTSIKISTVGNAAVERLSIGALGVVPIFSAIAIAEVIRLIGPSRWATPRDGFAPSWGFWLALVFAAMQAWGLAIAMEDSAGAGAPLISTPGWPFRASTVASMVGTTALLWWLSSMITRHGLGSGFWWIFLAPQLGEFANLVPMLTELVQSGAVAPSAIPPLVGFAVLVVYVITMLYRRLPASDRGEVILWPVMLAPIALGLLLIPFATISVMTSEDILTDLPTWFRPGKLTWLLAILALVWLAIVLRNRRSPEPLTRGELGLLGFGLTAIVVAADILDVNSPYPVFAANAASLIAITVVMLTVLRDAKAHLGPPQDMS